MPTRAPPHCPSLALLVARLPSVKADQVVFQALKKQTGNTFTAKSMPMNMALSAMIVGGCGIAILSAFGKLYYGKGKIELKD